jgi:hypothetical protein
VPGSYRVRSPMPHLQVIDANHRATPAPSRNRKRDGQIVEAET